MEAAKHRKLLKGDRYDHLFPVATLVDTTVKRNADVSHTVKFLPQVVGKTRWQVKKFVDQELKGLSTYEACEKLWHFVKNHIGYSKDEQGFEQVRSPRRLWHDRTGDCDCYTVFISACLSLLKIPVIHRIAKYKRDYFQHIYPIVLLPEGGYLTLDCVVEEFNYEEPYSDKRDYPMELQFLDGLDSAEMGAISLKNVFNNVKTAVTKAADKVVDVAKEGLHVINKVNPATLLLRAGVLAGMKLNFMNVAGRLKWAYLSEAEAVKRGVDRGKFGQLKNILTKLEKIFHTAGGEPHNLKEAILTGRGNRNKEVSGLGTLSPEAPLSEILGWEIMQSENLNEFRGLDGLGELGEPATAASIAAASGALATIAALLKQIGNLFPKGAPGAADFEAGDNENATEPISQVNNIQNLLQQGQQLVNSLGPAGPNPAPSYAPQASQIVSVPQGAQPSSTVVTPAPYVATAPAVNPPPVETPDTESFWDKNKSWLKPTLIAGGGLVLTVAGIAIYRASTRRGKNLSGIEEESREEEYAPVALM